MKKILSMVFLATLAACGTIPPVNFSVPNVGVARKKVDAELRSMTVTLARPEEVQGTLETGIEWITAPWQTALQEAIDRNAVFKDDASKKVSLQVKVLGYHVPPLGQPFAVRTTARYELIDRANGGIIFTKDITAYGIVTDEPAYAGRVSVNRSVQNNIAQFLQALESVDVSKPMFPAPAQK